MWRSLKDLLAWNQMFISLSITSYFGDSFFQWARLESKGFLTWFHEGNLAQQKLVFDICIWDVPGALWQPGYGLVISHLCSWYWILGSECVHPFMSKCWLLVSQWCWAMMEYCYSLVPNQNTFSGTPFSSSFLQFKIWNRRLNIWVSLVSQRVSVAVLTTPKRISYILVHILPKGIMSS